jgi:putative transcriptional regulator
MARVEQGLTQAQLASKLGVSRQWLIDIERGRGNPSYETLFRIAEKMGFQIEINQQPKSSNGEANA